MSSAVPKPLSLDNDQQASPKRHLRSVAEETLAINPVPRPALRATYQEPKITSSLTDPADEYAPQRAPLGPRTQSNIVSLRKHRAPEVVDRRYLEQREAIKKMTQTIGSAFVEAELGLRPFMQLSSWIELELFQKLRARVERTVNGNYLVARCNELGDTKVPSIIPIGVRAEVRENGDWETSMTIRVGQRARAIAMRLCLQRERWKVTAFEIG